VPDLRGLCTPPITVALAADDCHLSPTALVGSPSTKPHRVRHREYRNDNANEYSQYSWAEHETTDQVAEDESDERHKNCDGGLGYRHGVSVPARRPRTDPDARPAVMGLARPPQLTAAPNAGS
jgi:hypothetical protein